ncbi:hypothetical protein [Gracilimonas sp.]|uniref:hypothetical protein n=1 Tax=Gracilimonas sp. TaxID=1974203 RepID=UPI0032EEFE1E
MTPDNNRTSLQSFLFRFVSVYLLLYILPVVWLAALLGVIEPDELQLSQQKLLIIRLGLSLAGATIWHFFSRQGSPHSSQVYLLKLGIRSLLFINMMVYGLAKVAMIQFSGPTLERLIMPVGELSPMGLLWTFMGYSGVYQIFAGLMEVAGGFFLLFRKTTTLGALLIAGVMSNVALMNFTFDVPVKNLATHLFVFSLILAAFDYKRILNVFVFNKETEARVFEPPIQSLWFLNLTKWVKRTMVTAVILGFVISTVLPFTPFLNPPKPELFGIYKVTTQEPSFRENAWQYLVIDYNNLAYIRYDHNSKPYSISINQEDLEITLKPRGTGSERIFNYELDGGNLNLIEIYEADTLHYGLTRVDEQIFRLTQ